MLELIFLGTGGATPTANRDNTSFLIKIEKEKILIDCPGSIVSKVKKIGVNPAEIDYLFLTHIHPDHIYGLPSLVHGLMLIEKTLFVYGSEETISFVAQLLDLFKLRQGHIKYQTELISLKPGEEKKISQTIKVKTLATPHHSSSLAYLFNFDSQGKKWLFSGDTPPHPPLWELAKEVDLLIHEASAPHRFFEIYPELKTVHTSSYQLGLLAKDAQVKHLIPCHFFGEVDFTLEEIDAEIRLNYQGELFIPKDLVSWPEREKKKEID